MRPKEPRLIDPAHAHQRVTKEAYGVRSAREIDEDAQTGRELERLPSSDRPRVTGSHQTGEALRELLSTLEWLGLIADETVIDPVFDPPSSGGGTTIEVQEGGTPVDAAADKVNFDDTDFNVSSSPSGRANVSLNYGTGANQPAEGSHTHALGNLSDVNVASPGSIPGKTPVWDGSSTWNDQWVYTGWIGPWFQNDVPGTASTTMGRGYFNTATALSRSTNPERAGRVAYIVGAKITSDAARTAGTATVEVMLNGSATSFDSGSVALDASRTTQDASIVVPSSGIAVTSGGDTIGARVVTSGWTPTTANITVELLIMYSPIG